MALPPTATKFSTDVNNITTFFFDFPNFTGSHSGITATLGINSVAGGGTGLATLTLNNVILGNGTASPTFVAPGTAGNILTSNGTTWISSPPTSTTTDSFSVYLNTTTSFSANAPIIYDTKFFDNASAYNTTTGLFTTPTTGDYQFNVVVSASGTNTAYYLWKNATQFIAITQAASGGVASGAVVLSLVAGDTIYVSPDTTRSFTGVSGGIVFNTFSGFLLGGGGSGSGTVTSVAFADASTTPIYTITGSPVTTTGTLTQTLATQAANFIFAGPTTGSPAQPTFRNLVAADIPTPLTTAGDLLFENNTPAPDRLPIGLQGQFLTVSAGLPAWVTQGGATAFTAYNSSQITTISSPVTSNSFTTFSNSPAFTITPTITGTYKIYSNLATEVDTANNVGMFRIINTSGSATLLAESQGLSDISTTPNLETIFVQSVYTLTAGTTYVFDIQGRASTSANAFLRGDQAPFYMFAEGIALITTNTIQGNLTVNNGHYKSTQTTAPTTTTLAGAGTGASSSVSHATDTAGMCSLVSGTLTLGSGGQFTVNFNAAYAVAPIVQLTPQNSATIAAYYVTSTTAGFTVNFVSAGLPTTTYSWFYTVMETQ